MTLAAACKANAHAHDAAVQESFVVTEFGNVGFTASGAGGAVPLVFLHGVGSDKSVWAPQLEFFGRQRIALAFDYPGYGDSDYWDGATRDDFAGSILSAMDELRVERAHVCGLSLGGVIALAMHATAPSRCTSLIIADSFAVHPDGQGIYDRSITASRSMAMQQLAEGRVTALLGSAASDDLRAEVVATMAAIDPAAFRLGAAAVWLADQRDRASAIDVPTLILCGDEDRVTPPALSEELHQLIVGSRLEIIPASGHLANAEQPQRFNDAVERFLREIETDA